MKSIKSFLNSYIFVTKFTFKHVKKESIIGSILVILRGALPYLSAFLLGRLVTVIVGNVKNASDADVWQVLVFYAVIGALPAIIGNFQSYNSKHRMSRLQIEAELEILKNREKIDIAKYEEPEFQDLIQRAFRNGPNPIFQIANSQLDILRLVSSLAVGTFLAIHFNAMIYLVVIATAIPSFIMDIRFAGFSWSIWSKDSPQQRRYGDLRQHINSTTSLIETKLFQSGKKILDWARRILEDFAEKQLSLEKSKLLQFSITDLTAFLGFAGGLYLVVKGVLSGEYEVGALVYMMSTLSNVRSSIAELLSTVSGQFENHLMLQDMIQFFNTKPVIVEAKNPTKIKLASAPEIVFENVSFKYNKSNSFSLKNLNLTFKAGDNIGLVGNNGAGKTTLVKLLCRIYEPTEGRILINGIDLKEISTKEWWSYLAVMFQDYASYDFLVKDAIAISRPDKSTNLTKVVEAAHTSQAYTFIEEWEHKYDEQLGVEFKGKQPSKGQRQKLSIAKTLYRDGFVMILDEPTASVDAESESKIFDSIESLPKDRTAILISHDFSTISACDKIFVLEKAELIEEGNHKELMKKKGKYAELYNLQAKRFKK